MQGISLLQNTINDGINRIVTSLFGPDRKSPSIQLKETNYSYEVFEDTGTGTAYASLIVLDLAIFKLTILPFIAHDSVLFKNIENDSVSNLFKIYSGSEKQAFVAIDEIYKYGDETSSFLSSQSEGEGEVHKYINSEIYLDRGYVFNYEIMDVPFAHTAV